MIKKVPKKLSEKEKEEKSINSMKTNIKIGAVILGIVLVLAIAIILIITKRDTKITAEDLLAGIKSDYTYSDINLNIDFKVAESDIEMITDVNIVSSNDIQHITGNLNTSLFGIVGNTDVETWVDSIHSYTYDKENDSWTSSLNKTGDISINEVLSNINQDLFIEYKLEDYTKKDTELAITGQLSNEKFFGLLGNLVSSNSSITDYDLTETDSLFEDATYEFMLVFDKSSKKLTYIQFNLEDDSDNVFKFIVQINELNNNDTLEIPSEITDNSEFKSSSETPTDAEENTLTDATEIKGTPILNNIAGYEEVEFIDLPELEKLTNGRLKQEDNLSIVVQTFLNEYSEDDLILMASTWGKLDEDIKEAIAYIYNQGWVDTSKFAEIGLDTDEISLYYTESEE